MPLELRPVTEPYASVYVAHYEPIVIEWWSTLALGAIRKQLLVRLQPARPAQSLAPAGGPKAPTIARYRWYPQNITSSVEQPPVIAGAIRRGDVGERVPGVRGTALAPTLEDAERIRRRDEINRIFSLPHITPTVLRDEVKKSGLPALFGPRLEQALSVLGIMHLYRQLYFDAGGSVGPVEQAIALAPHEQVEVIQETMRRRTAERIEEFTEESSWENTTEQELSEEIADAVHTAVMRDMSVGVSTHASGSVGVFSGGASINADLSLSTEQAHEFTRTRSQTLTKKTSEVIRKSHSLTVRTVTESTDRQAMRRLVSNPSDTPINYALRRMLRKIRIKVQALGPRLVWQLYVSNPGLGLLKSRLLMYREADAVAPPDLPPNAPPEPQGGVDTGSQTLDVEAEGTFPNFTHYVSIPIVRHPEREYTGMTIDSITDPDPGKDPSAPGIVGEPPVTSGKDSPYIVYRFRIAAGTASRVIVNYSLPYRPSDAAMQAWQDKVTAARAAYEAALLDEQFERARKVVTSMSKVKPRPAADQRGEERYEVLNRMISETFRSAPTSGIPGPVEIELFHRYFDLPALCYFVHPSWWRPRYVKTDETYEITDESDPAPFGKSLGWVIQLDGDRRRNEFLNCPWVRVCVPIRPGLEEDAVRWLADHLEGERGLDLSPTGLAGKLLTDIRARRAAEVAAVPGPDYVTLDGEVAPDRTMSADAYPVVDEFDVVVPTDGFLYHEVKLTD
jgi:hypothetical protein